MISRISGTSPSQTGLDSRVRSSRCSNIPSRSSGQRPRPAWAAWNRLNQSNRSWTGSTTRPRSSGARPPGPLRRLGNRGIGVDAIKKSLQDPNPLTRRGAVRIFAYQFYGMDTRLDLAERLLELSRDPDLWTRLQALKTLRQWFYRTNDQAFQRRIIDTYLARMAEPEVAVVRKNLSEGLYIMLDENLGGGVSLQKNIAQLPESLRPRILEARRSFERDVLLTPVLGALERGTDLQRTAVLDAFDGSFFKGRHFARQPEAMIDVGNDREFGFLYEPGLDVLESTFAPLMKADLPARSRQQVLQLASFFRLPARTQKSSIQAVFLRRLLDPDPGVRASARAIVSDELDASSGLEAPEPLALLRSALEDGAEAERDAALQLIGRDERLVTRPEILDAIRRLVNRQEVAASLLPVLRWPVVHDAEVLAIVLHGWPKLTAPQRLQAIEALLEADRHSSTSLNPANR